MSKTFLAAIIFSFIPACIAQTETSASPASDSGTVVVVTSGSVPGFTSAELSAYLARRMHEQATAPWQFAAATPATQSAPNRMVWSFRNLRVVWKGATHRGFASPENSESYLSVEVKLYMKNDYQLTTVAHPSVRGGPDDKALSAMVEEVAHAMFAANGTSPP